MSTIHEIEIPQSTKIIEAGYTLGSMMDLYRDMYITAATKCNDGKCPYSWGVRDTRDLSLALYFNHVFEVIFVKYSGSPQKEQDIVLAYMAQAETRRLTCPECWKNYVCDELCP